MIGYIARGKDEARVGECTVLASGIEGEDRPLADGDGFIGDVELDVA